MRVITVFLSTQLLIYLIINHHLGLNIKLKRMKMSKIKATYICKYL